MATEQIDMDKFPYKAGDELPNGIKVLGVIKGTVKAKDTFAGYRCRVILGLNKQGKKIYGDKEVIVPNSQSLSDPQYFPNGTGLEIIEMLTNPEARRVYFRVPGEESDSVLKPEEFLEIADKKATVDPSDDVGEGEERLCQGITASGKACKRYAADGEDFCAAHLKKD